MKSDLAANLARTLARFTAALLFAAATKGLLPAGLAAGPTRLFPDTTPVRSVEELARISLPNTTIDSVAIDPDDGSCRVTATVTTPGAPGRIKVFIALPAKGWNGRFLGTGGGGFRGGRPTENLAGPVGEGFATGATDAGNPAGDGRFALDAKGRLNWPAIQNYAYVGIHEMTRVGKALTQAFYGKAPRYSYFLSGSTGGRQALIAVQRYPADYDGVVSNYPAISLHRLSGVQLWPQVVMHSTGNFVSPAKLEAVNTAAIASCDGKDGVLDGVIDDPERCSFDPATLVGTKIGEETFTENDALVVRRIWAGPRTHDGSFLGHGLLPGTDLRSLAKTEGTPRQGQPFSLSLQWFRYFVVQDPEWDWTTLTSARFEVLVSQSIEQYGAVLGGDDPNLTRFRDRGGKLMIFHGLADTVIPAGSTIDFYRSVEEHMGGRERTAQFTRLFLVPGVGHGFRGVGPSREVQMQAIMRWVEEAVAPESVLSNRKNAAGQAEGQRPLFPYPYMAKYSGSGSAGDPRNYTRAEPAR